jgi:itaconate CoA-transferase
VQAESGLASITGHPAGPGRVGVSVCDIACGMSAHAAVLEALISRSLTGRGRRLEVSLFDGIADWMNVPLLYYEGTGKAPQRVGLAHPSICPYGAFAMLDGGLVLISIQNEREWSQFCALVLEDPELATQPGFESNNARVANRPAVDARLAHSIGGMTRGDVRRRLGLSQTAYGFVNELADLGQHPALRRVSVETPGGIASIVAPPTIHDGAAPCLGKVPAIGEHNAMIRAEFAATSAGLR